MFSSQLVTAALSEQKSTIALLDKVEDLLLLLLWRLHVFNTCFRYEPLHVQTKPNPEQYSDSRV